jgi:hypothetical protein
VGPLPVGVYWRRRGVLLVGLLAVLLVLRSCGGGDDTVSSPEATPTPTPSVVVSTAPTSTAAPAPAAPAACRGADLALEVAAQPATSPTSFVVTATNRGTAACRVDLGPAAVQLVVTSGADRVWARSDCERRTARELATLAPGASRGVRVAWDGRRSKPDCAGTRSVAAVGTYRVTGTVGTAALPTDVFQVR